MHAHLPLLCLFNLLVSLHQLALFHPEVDDRDDDQDEKLEVTMPPMTGVARGRITSDPACMLHIRGRSPKVMAETVMSFGRSRRTAPSITASPGFSHPFASKASRR